MNPVEIRNPASLSEVVGTVTTAREAEVETALAQAHTSYTKWARVAPEERAGRLKAAADALTAASPDLTKLFTRENGKPLREADRDIKRSIELMRIIAEDLPAWWKPELVEKDQPVWTRRRARGVTAVISPWNSPVLL